MGDKMEGKLKNIEFIRIIGCIAIILFHLLYNSDLEITKNGNKAVDLFFIISGFFFIYKINLNISLFQFVKHKLIRLYPVILFAFLIVFILSLFGIFHINFYNEIFLLLGLTGTALSTNIYEMPLGQCWYCSSLVWILVLFFYLLKNYKIKNVNLVIALGVFFCYSFILDARNGIINGMTDNYYHIFNLGLMRAFGGIGIGYFIGNWYKDNCQKFFNLKLGFFPKIYISVLEFICLYFVISNLTFHNSFCPNHFIFIIAFIILIMLFLFKKGYLSQFFDKQIFCQLGKYSYSIFVTHLIVIYPLRQFYFDKNWMVLNPGLCYISIMAACILLGIITYHLIEKPFSHYLNRKFPLIEDK